MSQQRIVRYVEDGFVAYLKTFQESGGPYDGVVVLPGHGVEELASGGAHLVVTAVRPRQVLAGGGNYELTLQVKLLNPSQPEGADLPAAALSGMALQDAVVALVEAALGYDARTTVSAALNESLDFGVIAFWEEDPHEEARAGKDHGTAWHYGVEAYLKQPV